MRVRVDSIGCRLNIGEMEELARRLAAAGHRIVGPGAAADLFLFNSCAVTHVASRKSRKVLRQIRRDHPTAPIVATGCYAELSPRRCRDLGVDLVVGNADKDRLPEILESAGLLRGGDPVPEADAAPIDDVPDSRTRAFVKVQDGCDNVCTFCIVTRARGDGRSRGLEEVLEEIRGLTGLGYQEAVLSGVHLGSWGHDLGDGSTLGDLVWAILERTEIPRLRLSSLEPWDLDPDFFELWENSRLQPHLHLPLQSGCDLTLARMARRTSQEEYAALVDAAREAVPDVAVSTDVIVGFPGEDDAEFEDSLAFVRAMEFSRLHVFRYSPRQGTAAAGMPGQVDHATIQERSGRMHELGAELESRHRRSHVGRRAPVLWETSEPFGDGRRWSGLTGNYLRVVTDTGEDAELSNRITDTDLLASVPGALWGRTDASRATLWETTPDATGGPSG